VSSFGASFVTIPETGFMAKIQRVLPEDRMKHFLIVAICLAFVASALAQTPAADEPASRDDVILLLRTMHSHDFMQKVMSAQSAGMRQIIREQAMKDGSAPADFDRRFGNAMDDLIKGMPMDELTQAMIPAYQKHFTHGDIEAMNTFYSSPVGQKVLEELPAVMQEGLQDMMPILTKYLSQWKERMQKDMQSAPAKTSQAPPAQN
jgi:uncharacterized protein